MNLKPPRLAERFLSWFCPPHLLEGIEGDLLEEFHENASSSLTMAQIRFVINVLKFFRPSIIMRNRFSIQLISVPMLRNYFTISWRHVLKNKSFAVINISGLAVGMAAALLVYDYVTFEKSFDSFHSKADQIYRVTTVWNKNTTPNDKRAMTMPWAGPNVAKEFPEVLDYAFFTPIGNFTGFNSISYQSKKISEPKIFLADDGFLRIFSFQMIEGDRVKALRNPNSIVITESIAKKYFGTDDPIGKILTVDTRENLTENIFTVTGVIKDPPSNSHIDFDFLISFNVIHKDLHNGSTFWHWDYTYAYLLLHPDTNVPALEKKISDLRVSQFGKEMEYFSDAVEFELQPVRDIHLNSNLRSELSLNGDGRAIFLLSIIGTCILLSAFINYVNLSTIKAVERKTEIGIRKVIGSTKAQLIAQLFVESLLFNGIALILALAIYSLSIPVIQNAFNIQWPVYDQYPVLDLVRFIFGLLFIGMFLSILYPAFVLSSFKPAEVLKGKASMLPVTRGFNLRKVLIVCQFIFCIGFTIATYTVFMQMKHMQNFDLGMNIERVVAVRGYGFEDYSLYEKYKYEVSKLADVKVIGATSAAPGDEVTELAFKLKVHLEGQASQNREVKNVLIDEGYFQTLGVQFVAGRNFDRSIRTDNDAVIINEAAAKLLGYEDASEIIGESIANMSDKGLKIIGVIRNYNQRSLKEQYEPIIFSPMWNHDYGWHNRYYVVKLNALKSLEDYRHNISALEKSWKKVNPSRPFQYFFLDTHFNNQYKADTTFSSLFIFFSALAIFIACLGLFGLVAYTTLQRTKEIGVRKVLGASVNNILSLLSRDFVRLILLAVVISVPLIVWAIDQWLSQYAFRISLSVWLFTIPIALIVLIAFVTIVLKCLKVATANPVQSLRYE